MDECKLTIFTPTYNRGYILKNCYESLCRQTNKNFLWLIVDDGSTDNTEELVEIWKNNNQIDIKYFKQNNSGKHIAHNTGVSICKTSLFVCVDSDDYLVDSAVESIYKAWGDLDDNKFIAGIIALKGYSSDNPIGTRMPPGISFSKLSNLYKEHRFKGDAMLIYKTEILKRNLFPFFEGEKFVTEAVVYDQIDQEYKMKLLDKVLNICEYLEDGYSKNLLKVHRDNPKGYIYFFSKRVDYANNGIERFQALSNYLAACWKVRTKHPIKNSKYKILCILSIPNALYIYNKQILKRFLIKTGLLALSK